MSKKISMLLIALLVLACTAWGQEKSWTGVVSDTHCGTRHSAASDQAASCVAKCVSGGAKYVLVTGTKAYKLDAQEKFVDYAGKTVKVTGEENGDTITVSSVEAAKTEG